MKTATTHEAKTHLSRLIREVQSGETVIVLNGHTPVAKLTSVQDVPRSRPRVGTVTSAPVSYTEKTFEPLSDSDLKDWDV